MLTRTSPSCPFPPCSLPMRPVTPPGTGEAARCALGRDRAPSPALPAVHIAARLCQLLHARPRAIAVLAPDEGVAAKGLGLTDNAFWLQGVRRADALPRHFVTETCPTVTGWKRQKEAVFVRARPRQPKTKRPEQETGQLTPAVGEAPVAGGAAGALSPDDVGLAGTLPAEGLALAAPCPGLMALAGLRPVVVEEGQGDGGVAAKPRRCAGTAGEGRRSHRGMPSQPSHHPKIHQDVPQRHQTGGMESPVTLRSPKHPRVWSVDKESINQSPPLPRTVPAKGKRCCFLWSMQPSYSRAATQSQRSHLM